MTKIHQTPETGTRTMRPAQREVDARVITYGTTDSHGTQWEPGCFTASLEKQLPAVCWAHRSDDIIGSVVAYRDGPEGLDVTIKMADFDAVPRARSAWSLIKDGHVKGYSVAVGKDVSKPHPTQPGVYSIQAAELLHVSPVLRPSVEGTATLGVRSRQPVTASDDVELTDEYVEAFIDLMDARQREMDALRPIFAANRERGKPASEIPGTRAHQLAEEERRTKLNPEWSHEALLAAGWGGDGPVFTRPAKPEVQLPDDLISALVARRDPEAEEAKARLLGFGQMGTRPAVVRADRPPDDLWNALTEEQRQEVYAREVREWRERKAAEAAAAEAARAEAERAAAEPEPELPAIPEPSRKRRWPW